jgi:hypothetical protein
MSEIFNSFTLVVENQRESSNIESSNGMSSFFECVEGIQSSINAIEKATEEIYRIGEKCLLTTPENDSESLSPLAALTVKKSSEIRQMLIRFVNHTI